MDFREGHREAAFRAEAREWIGSHLPTDWQRTAAQRLTDPATVMATRRWWQRELQAGGWIALTWPTNYGGRDASLLDQVIFNEELARAKAPEPINVIGLYMVGPTIIEWGTPRQRERYLPPLLSGDEIWCQGFSEPNAGSDLAALRTRAERHGDQYLLNGQKAWTIQIHGAMGFTWEHDAHLFLRRARSAITLSTMVQDPADRIADLLGL
jgi:alkylation response protein AidB-like acyl-CoA dehydrogenase